MKKLWLYMAVPMTILNGCQNQQLPMEAYESAALEASKEKSQTANEPEEPTQTLTEESARADTTIKKEAEFSGSIVTIAKSGKAKAVDITAEEIEAMVRAAAGDLNTVVKNGQTVVLKPNLVQMKVDSTGELLDQEVNGITTDWRVTKAVMKMVRELNPDGNVYIMEGSASGPTSEVMKYFHYTPEEIKGADGFICLERDCGSWQDFDAPEVVKVDLPEGLLHKSYYFNRILYEADVIISLPALKTSSGVVVTGGIKNVSIGTPPGNLYGLSPGNPSKMKMVSHKIKDGKLDQWIYDYYTAKPVNYVIVDGLQGFQSGPIPMSQERKETDKMNMGLIMAGKDAVAVDNICALLTGWDPESVGYLSLFREKLGAGEIEKIRVKGAYVDELRKNFTIMKTELGGIPIEVAKGPELSVEIKREGERLKVFYRTDENACKVEVFVDECFQYSGEASAKGTAVIEVPGLSYGDHEIKIVVYDRFLNRSEKISRLENQGPHPSSN